MKNLNVLLKDIKVIESVGEPDLDVSNISLNSKDIKNGGLFVAIIGEKTDGHKYVDDAIHNGAIVIVHQNDLSSYKEGVTYIKVLDTHLAVALIANAFYDYPSEQLKLVGVTGTNGKTTIATLLYQLFYNIGYRTGLVSTIENRINNKIIETDRTTPDAISLNKILRTMVDEECAYAFMEVSSHSVSEQRVAGITFVGGIFTNLTQDHLDYHKTMENYRDAKKQFFDMLPDDAFALVNTDDENGSYIFKDTKAKKYSYGFKHEADFMDHLETKLIGEFNQYNILAIYGAAVLLEEDRGLVKNQIKNLEPVRGRFQYVKGESGVIGIVDYAHTPDALENVLKTINELRNQNQPKALLWAGKDSSPKQGFGRIISLFGCGGDRDKTKRPIMAKIGYDMSDIVILTSDNPRTEDPDSILKDMEVGLPKNYKDAKIKKVYIISDRGQAIKKACEIAKPGDYLLLAGKGHEVYQEMNGGRMHFDDMEELKKYLK